MRPLQVLLVVLLLAGCAAQPPPPPRESPAQQLEQAASLVTQGQYAQPDRILRSLIESAAFRTLDSDHQHQALLLNARTALQLRDRQRGLSLLKRACEMSEADTVDWFERLMAANWAGEPRDAAAALVVLATRWPQVLPSFETPELRDRHELESALRALQESGSDADRYTVLSALFDAHFAEEPLQASVWWRDLSLLQLERGGDQAAAAATLARVTDAYVVISVEADKRFDPIRVEASTRLDVAKTAERAIAAWLRQAEESPSSLRPMVRLSSLLRSCLRYRQALQVDDSVIERQQAEGPQVYRDYDRYYVWILNDRARALWSLGRWDAAVIQMEAASRMPELGETANVSQALNLAHLYAWLGRPAEALKTLERAGQASAYGEMVSQAARLDAAAQLNDTKTVGEALHFMSDHRLDRLSGYQQALLVVDREDEGARLLISRLADPRLRSDALLAVQQYGEEDLPPRRVLERNRWRVLIARRDVQEAIRQVGYVKKYPLEQREY